MLADGAFGDVLAIIGGSVGVGAGFGSLVAWLVNAEPRWGAGAGYGSLAGFAIGVLLAIVDLHGAHARREGLRRRPLSERASQLEASGLSVR